MKRVLVAAGTSVNKMNSVATTIKDMCAKENVNIEVLAENVYEADIKEINPDVIVLLGVNQLETDIPIVNGVPFMTTLGIDTAIHEIISKLN